MEDRTLKKSLLNIMTLVLVLTNTVLMTVMLFVVVPAMQDSNRVIKKVAQAVNLELDTRSTDSSNVPLEDCETFDLETKLTIALKKGSDGKDHYAVVYPTLLLYKNGSNYTKNLATLKEKKSLATQHIQEVIQKYTATELQNNPDAVREEAKNELQDIFGKGFIVQVVFGTTTIQ